jgi:16S rRNA (adenine1518-N6/adenine1519-N6)-dimethyltransferase
LLAEAGIVPTDRAEQISLEAFCRLSRLVAARS